MKPLFIAYRDGHGWLNVVGQKINCYSDYIGSASEATATAWKQFMEANSSEFELAPVHFLRVPFVGLSKALEEPKSGWQPIESAPKDGTRIILHWRNCRPAYASSSGKWVDGGKLGGLSGWKCDEDLCVPKNQDDCIMWCPIPSLASHA